MTAGNQPSLNSINQTAGTLAVNLRNDMQNIINFNAYLVAMGGVTFLTNGINPGMNGTDAAALVAAYGNLAQLAAIYLGQGTQAVSFDYEANSNILWGGQ